MANELCPECRSNTVPPRHYVCLECEERLAALDLEPGPAQKWWAFLKPPKKAVVEVVPEEEETVPVPRSYRVIRVLRGTFMTGLVGCVTLYAWNISHQAVRIVQKPSIHAPEFVQNIQKRSTSIVKELSDALN